MDADDHAAAGQPNNDDSLSRNITSSPPTNIPLNNDPIGVSGVGDGVPLSPEENQPEPPAEQSKKPEGFMQQATSKALRPFVIISSSYLLFTITDGAIRMIVLLHAYNKSFSAMQVALMFTLYELAGVFTNLVSCCMANLF
jgi:hypothetical protein